jgi:hypothetical protein
LLGSGSTTLPPPLALEAEALTQLELIATIRMAVKNISLFTDSKKEGHKSLLTMILKNPKNVSTA